MTLSASPASTFGRKGFEKSAMPLGMVLLIASVLASLCVGRFEVPVWRALDIILRGLIQPFAEPGMVDERIVLLVRAPRTIFAALAGAGLAVAGASLQAVFRNPLVSPQVLGVSQGAALGGAFAIVMGIWGLPLILLVSFGAVLALVLVGFLAGIGGRSEMLTIILAGMVVGALGSALVSLIQMFADPQSSLPAIVFWLMGSFSTLTWDRLWVGGPGIGLAVILLYAMRFRLNVLALGETEARTLGSNPDRERWIIFALVALIVGSQVAVSGIVGWVGLVIPHAARLLVGEDNRRLVPTAILFGAAYMVLVDTIARTATAAEIPLGILTAIVGAPVFALLLRQYQSRKAR